MKLNSELGYKPVTFSELTTDQSFWNGCQTCKNFDVLTRTEQKMCLCTGMLFDPKNQSNTTKTEVKENVFNRLKNTLWLHTLQKARFNISLIKIALEI